MASPILFFLLSILLYSFPHRILSFSAAQTVQTFIILVDSTSKPSIFPTHCHWYASEFADPPRILHTYDTVFHGFSASLTQNEADAISKNPSVLAVFQDRRHELHTTRSPQFLGLWSDSDYGSDVIIGLLDTGIWPERRSFSDNNLGPVPSRRKGVCQAGEKVTVQNCKRKLIGAKFFSKGDASASVGGPMMSNDTMEYRSPRDADGHGTHTASTAAGRYVFQAYMSGYASGIAKGVAPKARLAVYKVCWKNSGCFDSDILSAFDADEALREVRSIECVIPGFKGQGGEFTAGDGTVGQFIGSSKFADGNSKPRFIIPEWLDGKQVGFDKIVEAISVVKAVLDVVKPLVVVVTFMERAGWKTRTIVTMIVIMIMIIKPLDKSGKF